jgi:hypothetical protein
MVWYGVRSLNATLSPLYLFIYWSIFLACILVAFYCVLLDIRFIRLQFALERQRIFRETVGDQAFRKALQAAHAGSAHKGESGQKSEDTASSDG